MSIKKWTDVPDDKLRTLKLGCCDLDMVIEGTQIKELVITPAEDEGALRITAGWDYVKISVPSPPTIITAYKIDITVFRGQRIRQVFRTRTGADQWIADFHKGMVSDMEIEVHEVKVPEDTYFADDEEPTDEPN